MDECVRTDVFDARLARVDDENSRQNQRLELLEKNSASLNDLVVSVKELAMSVKQMQEELKRQGNNVSLINARFVKPLDEELLDRLAQTHSVIITMEENVIL